MRLLRTALSVSFACFATFRPTFRRFFANSTPPPSVFPVRCFVGPLVNPTPRLGLVAGADDAADDRATARALALPMARARATRRDALCRVDTPAREPTRTDDDGMTTLARDDDDDDDDDDARRRAAKDARATRRRARGTIDG